jgi:hypothetical protein
MLMTNYWKDKVTVHEAVIDRRTMNVIVGFPTEECTQ